MTGTNGNRTKTTSTENAATRLRWTGIRNFILLAVVPWAWLWAWSRYYPALGCAAAFLFLLPVLGVIALSMFEAALLRRRAFVGMYLRPEGGLYRLLRGGGLLLLRQILKAMVFGVILFVEAAAWPDWVWLLLFIDGVVLYLIYGWLRNRLASQVKAGKQGALARQALVWANTLVLAALVAGVQFYRPHTDYRDMGWGEAAGYEASRVEVGCEVLGPPLRLAVAKDAIGWWAAQHWLGRLGDARLALAGWSLFLVASSLVFWAYSRLVLGMSIRAADLWRMAV